MKLYWHNYWLVVGLIGVAMVGYLSLVPQPADIDSIIYLDKVIHCLVYLFLQVWFSMIYQSKVQRFMLAFYLISYSIGIEIIQSMTPYRLFEMADIFANSLGVLIGYFLSMTKVSQFFFWIEYQINHAD